MIGFGISQTWWRRKDIHPGRVPGTVQAVPTLISGPGRSGWGLRKCGGDGKGQGPGT